MTPNEPTKEELDRLKQIREEDKKRELGNFQAQQQEERKAVEQAPVMLNQKPENTSESVAGSENQKVVLNNKDLTQSKVAIGSGTSETKNIDNKEGTSKTRTEYDPEAFNRISLILHGGKTEEQIRQEARAYNPANNTYQTDEYAQLESAMTPQVEQEGVNSIYDVYGSGYTPVGGVRKANLKDGYVVVGGKLKRTLKEGYSYDPDTGDIVRNSDNKVIFPNVPDRYGEKDVQWLEKKLKDNKITKSEYDELQFRKKGFITGLAELTKAIGDAAVATPTKGVRNVAPVDQRQIDNPYWDMANQTKTLADKQNDEYIKSLQATEDKLSADRLKALEMSKVSVTDTKSKSTGESQTNTSKQDEVWDTSQWELNKKLGLEWAEHQRKNRELAQKIKESDTDLQMVFQVGGGDRNFTAKKARTKDGKYQDANIDASYYKVYENFDRLYPDPVEKDAALKIIFGGTVDFNKAQYYSKVGSGKGNYALENGRYVPKAGGDYNIKGIKLFQDVAQKDAGGNVVYDRTVKFKAINMVYQRALDKQDDRAVTEIGTPIELTADTE